MRLWRRDRLRPEVERQLGEIAFGRLKIFLPIVMLGVVVGLGISVPVGIPVPVPALFINGAALMTAIALYAALQRNAIPRRCVHPIAGLIWLLTPINTLSSYMLTDNATLALPMMLELATTAVLVDTRWTLAFSAPVLALAV